ANPPTNKYASCLNKMNGKILRINLDGTIPEDNPLNGLAMVTGCTEATRSSGSFSMQPPEKRIWAWGFRNPYRAWMDPVTGLFWVADVGEKTEEELDLVGPGKHYGYPFEEGSHTFSAGQQPFNSFGGCKGMVPSTECTKPDYRYASNSGG